MSDYETVGHFCKECDKLYNHKEIKVVVDKVIETPIGSIPMTHRECPKGHETSPKFRKK